MLKWFCVKLFYHRNAAIPISVPTIQPIASLLLLVLICHCNVRFLGFNYLIKCHLVELDGFLVVSHLVVDVADVNLQFAVVHVYLAVDEQVVNVQRFTVHLVCFVLQQRHNIDPIWNGLSQQCHIYNITVCTPLSLHRHGQRGAGQSRRKPNPTPTGGRGAHGGEMKGPNTGSKGSERLYVSVKRWQGKRAAAGTEADRYEL